MIEVDDLTIYYGKRRVLGGLSLSIRPGELVLVTGSSGYGKSTLLRALAGLRGGRIAVEGSPMGRRRAISMNLSGGMKLEG